MSISLRRWVLLLGAATGSLVAVLLVAAVAWPGSQPPLQHSGCRHHKHGARWHQDHGRMLGAGRGVRMRARGPNPDELAQRSLISASRVPRSLVGGDAD